MAAKKVYAQVFRLSGTGRKAAMLSEDTLGPNGNTSYGEWKAIREAYTARYGKRGVEFAMVVK